MTPILITARLASTRLPRKHLLMLGENTVIEHIVKRCKYFGFKPFVCVPDKEPWPLELGMRLDLHFGDPDDPEKRVTDIARSKGIIKFHWLDGDDPYFDPLEVERSMLYLESKNLAEVKPTQSSADHALGMMGTSINFEGKGTAVLPELRETEEKIRMTLDYEEDYWFLATVARLNGDPTIPRELVELTACHPIEQINLFRNKEWKARQLESSH